MYNGLSVNNTPYNYLLIVITNMYMLWKARKNIMVFFIIFVIAYSNYSIVFANFIMEMTDTLYTMQITPSITNISINILCVFNALMLLLLPWKDIRQTFKYNIFIKKGKPCIPVLLILGIAIIIVFFIGYTLPKEMGERGHPSPVYEYALSFFLCFFHFSGYNKKIINIGLVFIALYSLQNFIFGGRIYGLQFILGSYMMLFMHKVPVRWTLFALVSFFFIFSIIGVVRGALLLGDFNIQNIVKALAQEGFSLDTAYSAYYTSETYVYVMGQISPAERLNYFGNFILSIFLGESINESSKLINITREYMHHSGGGILPFHFYFYIGTIGIFLQALILKPYLNLVVYLKNSHKDLLKLIAIFIVTHSFRWYLYSPLGLFRGVLFLSLVYIGCLVIKKITSQR